MLSIYRHKVDVIWSTLINIWDVLYINTVWKLRVLKEWESPVWLLKLTWIFLPSTSRIQPSHLWFSSVVGSHKSNNVTFRISLMTWDRLFSGCHSSWSISVKLLHSCCSFYIFLVYSKNFFLFYILLSTQHLFFVFSFGQL